MPGAEEKVILVSHIESHGSIKGHMLIEERLRARISIRLHGIGKTSRGSHHIYLAILYNSLLSSHRRSW